MNMLEALRKLITQQTNTVGSVVSNIHGGVPRAFQSPELLVESTWGYAEVSDIPTLSLDDFYAILGTQNQATLTGLATVDGTLTVPDGDRRAFLLLGSFSTPAPRTVTLTFDTGDSALAQVAIYKDGVLERRGQGVLALPIVVDAGTHTIAIVCYGRTATLTAPSDLAFTMTEPEPAPPIWYDLTSQYLDQAVGTMQNLLSWQVDPKVGGWTVYRRNRKSLGQITAVTTQDGTPDFVVKITGSYQADLPLGAQLFASLMFLGSVRETSYDGTSTTVLVRPNYQAGLFTTTGAAADWTGLTALSGVFTPIATIRRTQATGIASWSDTQVSADTSYDYALQSYGLFDATAVSAYSEIKTVVSNDRTPPGSVTSLTATALNKRITVKFHTPSDADYAGVRVYFASEVSGTVTSGGTSTLTDTSKTFNASYIGWTLRNAHSSGITETRTVSAGSGNTLTVSAPWTTTPVAGETYKVSTVTLLATDYGLPNADDQLVFEPTPGYGTYYLIAFDMAGNEQAFDGAASFSYAASSDTYSDGYPNAEPRVALSTNLDTADLYVKLTTNVAESVRLFVKDVETAGAAIWGLVTSGADSTPRYVATGTELGPTDWFHNGTSFGQILNDIPLSRDNIVRRYLKATGQYSGLSSTWTSVVLNVKGQPWLESVDLVWDETTDKLVLKAVAGANTASVKFEVADNATFTSPLVSSTANLADGSAASVTTSAFTVSQRGKVYYGRVTPYNGALSGGVPTGLSGAPQQDTELVLYGDARPSTQPRVVLSTNQDTADLYVTVSSGVGEALQLFVRTELALSVTTWSLVQANGNSTPRYVASGTELGPTDWFFDGTSTYSQLLNDIALPRDNLVRRYVKAVGQYSGQASSWDTVTLNPKAQPWLESVDLVWDETQDKLTLKAVGGANLASVLLEIADNASYTSPIVSSKQNLSDGGSVTAQSAVLSGAARNKLYYARATPYNGALSGGNPTGLSGVPQADTEFVPAGENGVQPPTASIEVDVAGTNDTSTATLKFSGAVGTGGATPLQWQYKVLIDNASADPGFGAWQTSTLPQSVVVARDAYYKKTVTLQVKDNAGRVSDPATYVIVPQRPQLNPNGTMRRTAAYDDGGYAGRATTTDGLQFHSGSTDSLGRALNLHFNKSGDDLDDVPQNTSSGTFLLSPAIHGEVTVENANFEAPASALEVVPGYHAASATLSLDTTSPYNGTKSLKVVAASSGSGAVSNRQWRVRPSEQYRVTAALKCLANTYSARAALVFLDAAGSVTGTADALSNATTWTLVTGSPATVPANSVTAVLELITSGSAGTIWFDDVRIDRLRSIDEEIYDDATGGGTYKMSPTYQGGEITLDNANFETPATAIDPLPGYRPSAATISADATSPYSGSRSAKVVASAQFGCACSKRRWRVRAGERYRVSAALKSLSSGYSVEAQLQFWDGANNYLSGINVTTTSTTWVSLQGTTGTVPANTAWAQLVLQIDGVGGGTGWFDDIRVDRIRDAVEVQRGGGNTTGIDVIVGQLTDGGHAGSGMQDSGLRPINKFLGKSLSGDADSLDGVQEGTTYKRVVGVASGLITPSSSTSRFRCLVYQTGAGQTLSDATTTAINFNASAFDVGGLHDNTTNNTRITVPSGGATGAWLLMARIAFGISGSAVLEVKIRKNGTTLLGTIAGPAIPSGTAYGNETILNLIAIDSNPSVGDFYEVNATHYGTGTSKSLVSGLDSVSFSAINLW